MEIERNAIRTKVAMLRPVVAVGEDIMSTAAGEMEDAGSAGRDVVGYGARM